MFKGVLSAASAAAGGGHFNNGTRFELDQILTIAAHRRKHGTIGEAFLDPAIKQSLKSMVSGKRFLDIGCGVGDWCQTAAEYGAKSVDGLDIQEKMVELAKKLTSKLDNVSIQIGDVANMPYSDASFDVATSLLVTCNLSPEVFGKHFQELHRVLAPGGKAIVLAPTDWCHSRLYTKVGADPATVENNIAQVLKSLPKNPTTPQITKAFKDSDDIGIHVTTFAVDDKGDVFRPTSIDQLTNGQPVWKHTDVIFYPNFYYSDQSIITGALEAGLRIDSIENCFTEERRVGYNTIEPSIPIIEKCVKEPIMLLYHVSKPIKDEH